MRMPAVPTSFLCAVFLAGALVAEENARPSSDIQKAWGKVSIEKRDHAPLLQRQAGIPQGLAKAPVSVAILVLEPDLAGQVSEVRAKYDTMEEPAEVEVIVTEAGILDDDLLGIRHVVALARNKNNQWRVVQYGRGELRRSHLK